MNLNLRTTQNTSVPYIKCDFNNWKNEPWSDLMLFWWLPSNRLRDRENWESHYCTQKQHINAKYKSDSIAQITSVITFTPNFTTKLTLETYSILACSFRVQSKSHVTWGKIPDCQQHYLIWLYSCIFVAANIKSSVAISACICILPCKWLQGLVFPSITRWNSEIISSALAFWGRSWHSVVFKFSALSN